MKNNPFVILGVSENISADELYRAYKEKREFYEERRFEPGEAGAEACAKLEEIEAAYDEALEQVRFRPELEKESTYNRTEGMDEVTNAIKEGRMDDAQRLLDNCNNRTAEWHYLQAAVFQSKKWTADALKQMEFACDMEPNNQKYAEIKHKMENDLKAKAGKQNDSFYRDNEKTEKTYSGPDSDFTSQKRGCSMCDVCNGLICADCCCECMGGDLIRCC